VKFLYVYEVTLDKQEISSQMLANIKQTTINGVCSTESTLKKLEYMDLGYSYYDKSSKFVMEFEVSKKTCMTHK
jgi:hypothetical protein